MTPAQKIEAQEMRAIGASDIQIAKALGTTRQTVHAVLGKRPRVQRIAPPKAPAVTTAAFAAELRSWRARMSLSQSEAARLLRCKTQSISFWETERNGCALAASMLLLMKLLEGVKSKS